LNQNKGTTCKQTNPRVTIFLSLSIL